MIDHAVGVVLHAKRGDQLAVGEPLAEIHAATDAAAEHAAREVLAAYRVQDAPVRPRPVLLEVIR